MLSDKFAGIPDWRQIGKVAISLHDAMMSGFSCMYFQDPSLLQFQIRMQEEQHRNNLNTLNEFNDFKESSARDEVSEALSDPFYTKWKENIVQMSAVVEYGFNNPDESFANNSIAALIALSESQYRDKMLPRK